MGKIEKEVRKRSRKRNLQKIILGTVAASGLMAFALVLPNALQALAKLGFIKKDYRNRSLMKRSQEDRKSVV